MGSAKDHLTDQPLSMAVHSLPDLQVPNPPASGRGKLLALLLACSMPVLLALFVFFVVQPKGDVTLGQLMHPARPMPAVAWTSTTGTSTPLAQLKGQWLLVGVGTSDCQDPCAQKMFIQRQLREMLNKDKDRVDRVWLLLDSGAVPESMQALLGDATVLRANPEEAKAWLSDSSQGQDWKDQLFVIDPQGYAMWRMPAMMQGKEANAAKTILQKLLAASAVWDQPGR